ncbi:unnamed protein product [Moneuplotes crassus]|uniref:Uncharacterized protein n=1 Tax=Euplotes crassus TaxID=5936 RepID=A0AAD1XKH1_EUPCR|nr:unnamed protein product [Moneuplotes crassus]
MSTIKPKLFEECIPGLEVPVPMQFHIPENFQYKAKFIDLIEQNGGFVIRRPGQMNPLVIQIVCADRRLQYCNQVVEVLDQDFFVQTTDELSNKVTGQKLMRYLSVPSESKEYYKETFYKGQLYSISWLKESLLKNELQKKHRYWTLNIFDSTKRTLCKSKKNFSVSELIHMLKITYWEIPKTYSVTKRWTLNTPGRNIECWKNKIRYACSLTCCRNNRFGKICFECAIHDCAMKYPWDKNSILSFREVYPDRNSACNFVEVYQTDTQNRLKRKRKTVQLSEPKQNKRAKRSNRDLYAKNKIYNYMDLVKTD